MGLRKRGDHYHYEYRLKDPKTGKTVCYSGNTFESSMRNAEAFAKARIKPILQARTVEELLALRMRVLSGLKAVKLTDAWIIYATSNVLPASARAKSCEQHWRAFAEWMAANYPKIQSLHQVTPTMAQEYILSFKNYAAGTVRDHRFLLHRVFVALADEAGLTTSPFASVDMPNGKQKSHEAFTIEQIKTIFAQPESNIRDMFAIGILTGLRMKDVCYLRWSDINLDQNMIVTVAAKTKTPVRIPILDPLAKMLQEMQRDDVYVLPEIARIYTVKRTSVSYRIRKFLTQCGIVRELNDETRQKQAVFYGFHSCRHTFAYLAGVAGIPVVIVQSILGHMDARMTELYQRHATDADAQAALKSLSDMLGRHVGNDR